MSAERPCSSRRALNWLVRVQQLRLGNTEFHNFFSCVFVFALVHKLWLMAETWVQGNQADVVGGLLSVLFLHGSENESVRTRNVSLKCPYGRDGSQLTLADNTRIPEIYF